jgi:hypothetical protein
VLSFSLRNISRKGKKRLRSLKNVSSLESVGNKDGQRLDTFYILVCMIGIPYSLASCLIRFSCEHTCFPFASPRFVMHYPRCNTHAVRTLNCRHFRDVAQTPVKITDITLSRMTLAPATIFCRGIGTRSRHRRSKRPKRSRNLGPYTLYGLFQTKEEMCTKFGSD